MHSARTRRLCAHMKPDAAHLSALLALTQQDSPMLLWLIVGGLMALGPVLYSYIKVYDRWRGKSVDTSDFITRGELALVRADRDAQLAASIGHFNQRTDAISKRLETVFELLGKLQEDMPAIHRALGRLEGHDEAESRPGRRPR